MSLRFRSAAFVAVLAVCGALATHAFAGEQTLDFTTAQQGEGRAIYEQSCALCHGANLEGVSAPPLIGDTNLDSDTPRVGELYGTILHDMPRNKPGTLNEAQVTSIMAYLLSRNGMRATGKELTPHDAARSALPYLRRTDTTSSGTSP